MTIFIHTYLFSFLDQDGLSPFAHDLPHLNLQVLFQHHKHSMFSTARRWLRSNRTPIAVGVGVIGAGYVVTQYVLSKLNDARERMSSDRIAKEK